jgi:hypothetical protein
MKERILSCAAEVFGAPVKAVEPLRGGANNFVFRYRDRFVRLSGLSDPSRLIREYHALQWTALQGLLIRGKGDLVYTAVLTDRG